MRCRRVIKNSDLLSPLGDLLATRDGCSLKRPKEMYRLVSDGRSTRRPYPFQLASPARASRVSAPATSRPASTLLVASMFSVPFSTLFRHFLAFVDAPNRSIDSRSPLIPRSPPTFDVRSLLPSIPRLVSHGRSHLASTVDHLTYDVDPLFVPRFPPLCLCLFPRTCPPIYIMF